MVEQVPLLVQDDEFVMLRLTRHAMSLAKTNLCGYVLLKRYTRAGIALAGRKSVIENRGSPLFKNVALLRITVKIWSRAGLIKAGDLGTTHSGSHG